MLTDRDRMPFGIHKGKFMAEVPADYLDFISQQEWIGKWSDVEDYIKRCRKTIDAELKSNRNEDDYFSCMEE